LVTPYNQFPDEQSHLDYVRYVRLNHRLPPLGMTLKEIPVRVGFHPPLFYLASSIFYSPDASQASNIFRLRLFCLLLGAISLFFVWETCSILFPDQHAVRVLAMAFGAFNAQYVFTSSGISNVPMTNLTCAITMYLLLRMITKPDNLSLQSLLAGVCFGGALLSRTLTVYLFPVCLIVIAICSIRKEKRPLPLFLKAFGGFLFASLLVAGWWYGRNWLRYGDPVLFHLHQTTVGAEFVQHEPVTWLSAWNTMAILNASFWAYFGNHQYHAGIAEYAVYLFLEILAVIGLFEAVSQKSQNDRVTLNRKVLLLLILSVVLAIAEILGVQLGVNSPQGRYLFMAIVPICTILGVGIIQVFPSKHRATGSIALSVFLFLFCLYLLGTYWWPHYR
jgi:Dolichyl-phosphate-mannose-protein mannosyltransferase